MLLIFRRNTSSYAVFQFQPLLILTEMKNVSTFKLLILLYCDEHNDVAKLFERSLKVKLVYIGCTPGLYETSEFFLKSYFVLNTYISFINFEI